MDRDESENIVTSWNGLTTILRTLYKGEEEPLKEIIQ